MESAHTFYGTVAYEFLRTVRTYAEEQRYLFFDLDLHCMLHCHVPISTKKERNSDIKMIAFNGVTKSYMTKHGRFYVFKDLTLTFPEGKNIGILGPNGAGKSTLLRLIGRLDHPDKGEIVTTERISWPVGLSAGFQGSLSGRDNARFICKIHGVSGENAEHLVKFVEEFANIGKHFDLPSKTYSSGMRARVNFGLSMAFDFDYYLVDEITAVGDEYFKKKSAELFKEKRKHANIIMVSHNMRTLRDNCEVGVFMNHGQVELFDNIEDAIKVYSKS
jgi:capsular polysaccharide transport system ATP-binding protein